MKRNKLQKWLMCLLMLCLLPIIPLRAEAAETGGIHILNTNAGGTPLQGAVFRIAREATQQELADSECKTETLTVGDRELNVVYESFYSDKGMQGRLLWEVETDSAGEASVYGLSHGTHYLVETEAPEGYNLISVPIKVSVNQYSHLTPEDGIRDDAGKTIDNTIHIVNVRYQVPETGSSLMFPLVMAGVAVISSSLALLLLTRRRYR